MTNGTQNLDNRESGQIPIGACYKLFFLVFDYQTIKYKLNTKYMEFHGKLYGKIAGTFFETGKTTDDYDKLAELIKEAEYIIFHKCTETEKYIWREKYISEALKQGILDIKIK